MSIYASFLKKLGLVKESVRGTAEVTPTKWIAVTPDSELNYTTALLEDPTIRGVMSKYPSIAGLKTGSGSIKFPLRASDIGEFFHMLCDAPTSTEQTAFVVTAGSNDKIDFTEDGGAEVTATLTAGSYAMGTTSGTAGTLCALIKTQMEAVNGSDTYTVTYSRTTRKLTITKSAGVFVILWKTGTNGSDGTGKSSASLLGFTNVDTSSAIACSSDSTTDYPVFSHAFVPATATEPQAYTMFMDRGLSVKSYNLCNTSQIKLTRAPDTFINFEANVMFKLEASGSIGSPSYANESEEMTFQHDCIKIAGSSNSQVKNWDITFKNGLFPQKTVCGGSYISNFLATEYDAEGSFTIYFENETERAKFLAGTESSLQITITGDTITGAQTYKVVIDLDSIQYNAFPFGIEDNLLAAKVTFRANYSSTYSRVFAVTLTNRTVSY